MDIGKANKIAEEFIKKHNPNSWDGVGDTDKDFSTRIEVYDIFDKDIYMTIQFDIDSDEGGSWAHEVKLYETNSGEMIDGYFGRGIDSSQNIASTIMDLCKAYGVK